MDKGHNRAIVLVASLLIAVAGCGKKDAPQQENTLVGGPEVPMPQGVEAKSPSEVPVELKDTLDGQALLVSQQGNKLTVSFVLKNKGLAKTVVDLGPQTGKVGGTTVVLSQPGVALAALTNGELEVVDDQLRLGTGWIGLIAIGPGEQIERTIEFEVTDAGRSLLRTRAPAFLILQAYEGPPATVSGRMAIPIKSSGTIVREEP